VEKNWSLGFSQRPPRLYTERFRRDASAPSICRSTAATGWAVRQAENSPCGLRRWANSAAQPLVVGLEAQEGAWQAGRGPRDAAGPYSWLSTIAFSNCS
jgi:hypothetical protein